jgi:hypothetical protein
LSERSRSAAARQSTRDTSTASQATALGISSRAAAALHSLSQKKRDESWERESALHEKQT